MMKRLFEYALCFLFLSSAYKCQDARVNANQEKIVECEKGGIPAWLANRIAEMQQNKVDGEVIQYTYKNEHVFYINDCKGCADGMAVVYACDQRELCKFGGIAGFNTCPDFDDQVSEKRIIWPN
jgi:hypothetical protein